MSYCSRIVNKEQVFYITNLLSTIHPTGSEIPQIVVQIFANPNKEIDYSMVRLHPRWYVPLLKATKYKLPFLKVLCAHLAIMK